MINVVLSGFMAYCFTYRFVGGLFSDLAIKQPFIGGKEKNQSYVNTDDSFISSQSDLFPP
jgi:hypothetical protein